MYVLSLYLLGYKPKILSQRLFKTQHFQNDTSAEPHVIFSPITAGKEETFWWRNSAPKVSVYLVTAK